VYFRIDLTRAEIKPLQLLESRKKTSYHKRINKRWNVRLIGPLVILMMKTILTFSGKLALQQARGTSTTPYPRSTIIISNP